MRSPLPPISLSGTVDANGNATLKQLRAPASFWMACYIAIEVSIGNPSWSIRQASAMPILYGRGRTAMLGPLILQPGEQADISVTQGNSGGVIKGQAIGWQSDDPADLPAVLPATAAPPSATESSLPQLQLPGSPITCPTGVTNPPPFSIPSGCHCLGLGYGDQVGIVSAVTIIATDNHGRSLSPLSQSNAGGVSGGYIFLPLLGDMTSITLQITVTGGTSVSVSVFAIFDPMAVQVQQSGGVGGGPPPLPIPINLYQVGVGQAGGGPIVMGVTGGRVGGQSLPVVLASDSPVVLATADAFGVKLLWPRHVDFDGIADSGEPAVGVVATCTLAAAAGKAWVCAAIIGSLAGAAGVAVSTRRLRLRDGASGVGAIKWSRLMSLPATAGAADHVALSGLYIKGTVGNAMTLEFDALNAAAFESCSFAAYQEG